MDKSLVELVLADKKKISRPPNAFMIYAREHRKKFADLNPEKSNTLINRMLRETWRNLDCNVRRIYHERTGLPDNSHRKKYPANRYYEGPSMSSSYYPQSLTCNPYSMYNQRSLGKSYNGMLPLHDFFSYSSPKDIHKGRDSDPRNPCTLSSFDYADCPINQGNSIYERFSDTNERNKMVNDLDVPSRYEAMIPSMKTDRATQTELNPKHISTEANFKACAESFPTYEVPVSYPRYKFSVEPQPTFKVSSESHQKYQVSSKAYPAFSVSPESYPQFKAPNDLHTEMETSQRLNLKLKTAKELEDRVSPSSCLNFQTTAEASLNYKSSTEKNFYYINEDEKYYQNKIPLKPVLNFRNYNGIYSNIETPNECEVQETFQSHSSVQDFAESHLSVETNINTNLKIADSVELPADLKFPGVTNSNFDDSENVLPQFGVLTKNASKLSSEPHLILKYIGESCSKIEPLAESNETLHLPPEYYAPFQAPLESRSEGDVSTESDDSDEVYYDASSEFPASIASYSSNELSSSSQSDDPIQINSNDFDIAANVFRRKANRQ